MSPTFWRPLVALRTNMARHPFFQYRLHHKPQHLQHYVLGAAVLNLTQEPGTILFSHRYSSSRFGHVGLGFGFLQEWSKRWPRLSSHFYRRFLTLSRPWSASSVRWHHHIHEPALPSRLTRRWISSSRRRSLYLRTLRPAKFMIDVSNMNEFIADQIVFS